MELWGRLLFPLGLLIALVVGELSALHVVSDTSPAEADPGAVYGALCAGLAAIVLVSVGSLPRKLDTSRTHDGIHTD